MSDVVNKLWGFCHTLRHDGIDYGDYIEQLTYLLFLKMANERGIDLSKMAYEENKKKVEIDCSWQPFTQLSGTDLIDAFAQIMRALSRQSGLLGDIFTQAMPRFTNPVNLKKVINMIDEEDWSAMEVDVKGAAFEGLLEKSAAEGKKGAGQYFTPRVLIKTIVNVMQPDPRSAIFILLFKGFVIYRMSLHGWPEPHGPCFFAITLQGWPCHRESDRQNTPGSSGQFVQDSGAATKTYQIDV